MIQRYWLMNEQDRHNLFSELITRHQSELYAYIFAVVRNWEDADDLFQSVCLVLWRKFESFQPGSSFFAWARQTAKIEVSNFLRHKQLPSYVSEKLLDALAEIVVEAQDDGAELYLAALRRCRQSLMPQMRNCLNFVMSKTLAAAKSPTDLQRLQPSVCRSLNRIRRWLLECIQMELARQEHSGKEHS